MRKKTVRLLTVLAPLGLSLLAGCAPMRSLEHATEAHEIEALDRAIARGEASPRQLGLRAEWAAWLDGGDLRSAESWVQRIPPERRDARSSLLLCEAAARQRSYPAMRERCAAVLQRFGASPEAEVAALHLLATLDQMRQPDLAILAPLASGLQRCQQASRGDGSCLGLLLADARARLTLFARTKDERAHAATLKSLGALQDFWVCGPMAPASVIDYRRLRALDEDALQELVDAAPCRERHSVEPTLRVGAYQRAGVFVADTWFEVSQPTAFDLVMELAGAAQVRVDGATVIDRDRWSQSLGDMAHAALRLQPGWHHLRAVLLPGERDRQLSAWLVARGGAGSVTQDSSRPPTQAVLSRVEIAAPAETAARRWANDLDLSHRPWQARRLLELWTSTSFARPDRARALARRMVELYPDRAEAWYALFEATRSDASLNPTLRKQDSRRALEKVLRMDPQHLLAGYHLVLLDDEERPDQALQRMQQLAQAHPDYPWAQRRLHSLLAARGMPVAANRALQRALELAPGETSLGLAERFYQQQHAVAELADVRQRRQYLEPRLASLRPARFLLDMGESAAALAAFDRAFALAPDAAGHDEIWGVALAVGGPSAVVRRAQKRLQLFPGDVDAIRWWLQVTPHDRPNPELTKVLARAEAVRPGLGDWRRVREGAAGLSPWRWLDLDGPQIIAAYLSDRQRHPELYQGYGRVVVLNAGARLTDHEGRGLALTHRIEHILSKEAADRLGEVRPPLAAELDLLRVIKADGRVVEPQDVQATGDVSMAGIEIGDFVERRYLEDRGADSLDGSVNERFMLASSAPIFRSLYIVAGAPDELAQMRIGGRDIPTPRVQQREGLELRIFEREGSAALPPEPYAAPALETYPHIALIRGVDVGLYARRAARQVARGDRLSLEVVDFARLAVRGLKDADRRLSALIDAVVQRVPRAGRQRDPLVTLRQGQGNRLALLRVAARAVGLPARLVAVHRSQALPVESWSDRGLGKQVLLVEVAGSDVPVRMVDGLVRVGSFSAADRGGTVIEIDPSPRYLERLGQSWPVPDTAIDHARDIMHVDATLDARGGLCGHFEMTLATDLAGFVRSRLRGLDARQLKRAIGGWFASVVPGSELTSLTVHDAKDERHDLRFAASFTVRHFARRRAGALVVEHLLPKLSLIIGGEAANPATYLRSARRLGALYLQASRERSTFRLRLPAHMRALRRPDSFEIDGPFGRLAQHSKQEGEWITLRRDILLPRQRVAARDYPAFRAHGEHVQSLLQSQLIVAPRSLAAP